jgi:hypothetical protein
VDLGCLTRLLWLTALATWLLILIDLKKPVEPMMDLHWLTLFLFAISTLLLSWSFLAVWLPNPL